ncbi:MAG: hypothetical protein GEU80_16495 [Dehalococcoidia bacterium]|nr:hypothetical protein [Dehalococcoidia bacterium]
MSRNDHPLTRLSVNALRGSLPPPLRALIDAAIAEAEAAGGDLWAVGGAVRDCAAGLPVRDIDLATGGDVRRLAEAVASRAGAEVSVRAPELGTAAVVGPHGRLDLAPLRGERYAHPGAMPTVTLGVDIETDLRRRDFTVSAVALGLAGQRAGEVVDPTGGLDDLAAGRLRVLHDGSFTDDATRLWRGARVAAQHRLRPEPATAALIEDGARWLATTAGERLWTEVRLTAPRTYVYRTVALLDAWGVLRGTHAAWSLPASSASALARARRRLSPELLAALLLAPLDDRAAILGRLAAPPEARRTVAAAVRLMAPGSAPPSFEWLERHEGTPAAARTAAEWLAVPAERRAARARHQALRRWERTRPPLDGGALLALGVPEGPEVGVWLRRLRRARYVGTLRTAAEARHMVREGGGHTGSSGARGMTQG